MEGARFCLEDKAGLCREAEHDVHAFDGSSGSAFAEVVKRGEDENAVVVSCDVDGEAVFAGILVRIEEEAVRFVGGKVRNFDDIGTFVAAFVDFMEIVDVDGSGKSAGELQERGDGSRW